MATGGPELVPEYDTDEEAKNEGMIDVEVKYSYEAEQSDELSIKVGDILKNVQKMEGGWWEGELDGKRGMFPDNFVKTQSAGGVYTVDVMATGRQTGDPEDDGVDVEVAYSYEAQTSGYLSIKVGDIIKNVQNVAIHWWKGELNGKRGLFPSKNVKCQTQSAGGLYTVDVMATGRQTGEPEDDGVDVEAEYNFEAQELGDLSFKVGDILENVQKVAENWWEGELNGKKGYFPRNYVKTLSAGVDVEAEYNFEAQKPGDLSIKVGDILENVQKVADNWWEGELNGKRGYFPRHYVKTLSSGEKKKQIEEKRRSDGYHHISGNFGFYPMKVLGHGSHATVYEGEFGQFNMRPIAVKVVKCSDKQQATDTHTEIVHIYHNIQTTKEIREIQTMEMLNKSLDCKNIIQFIDSYIDTEKSSVYLAFELAKGTLHDYIKPSYMSWHDSLTVENVVRGIVDGVKYTHELKFVHRDLKPANIFIVEQSKGGLKPVIGDFGSAKATTGSMVTLTAKTGSIGYIAPEIWKIWEDNIDSLCSRFDRRSDIFSLALVMYFTLSLGKHPFGNPVIAQGKFSEQQPKFQHLSRYPNSIAHEMMLKRMLEIKPEERPRIREISDHPALWSTDRIMQFFVNKSDKFEKMIKADPSKDNILEDPTLIKGGNWVNQLPVNTKTYLEKYKVNRFSPELYNRKETSVRHLLRAVRNTERHHKDYPASARAELGIFPDGHIALWLGVCPGLLMHVYDKLGP